MWRLQSNLVRAAVEDALKNLKAQHPGTNSQPLRVLRSPMQAHRRCLTRVRCSRCQTEIGMPSWGTQDAELLHMRRCLSFDPHPLNLMIPLSALRSRHITRPSEADFNSAGTLFSTFERRMQHALPYLAKSVAGASTTSTLWGFQEP